MAGFPSRRQPELQPQVASYSRATSKSYLKQTEALWSCMNLSRQEGEDLQEGGITLLYTGRDLMPFVLASSNASVLAALIQVSYSIIRFVSYKDLPEF